MAPINRYYQIGENICNIITGARSPSTGGGAGPSGVKSTNSSSMMRKQISSLISIKRSWFPSSVSYSQTQSCSVSELKVFNRGKNFFFIIRFLNLSCATPHLFMQDNKYFSVLLTLDIISRKGFAQRYIQSLSHSGQNRRKRLYFECRINKNALPQTVFW